MADDPQTEALVRACLEQLDSASAAAATSYEDALYRLQDNLKGQMQRSEPPPTPEESQAVQALLGQLHPSADDHLVQHGTRLQRLLARVDVELSRWTSGIVQQPGPSGATAVAERPPEPVA
jgi:uncharacterized protein with beta-barrel porin domain